jgi:hypothetical protein
MPTLTISDALAEVQTIRRRIDQKQQLIAAYLLREAKYRDPLGAEGGSAAVLAREWASVRALHERTVLLRRLIQNAYERTLITFGEQTRSLADWLAWRREVSARRAGFLRTLSTRIRGARARAALHARAFPSESGRDKPADVIVHLNEQELAREAETLEELLGNLNGQLGLKNATITIDVPADDDCRTGLEERLDPLLQQASAAPAPAPVLAAPWSDSPELCRLAREPSQKISAIKAYRELTGVGLLEAKQAVEAFIASGR